MIGKLRRFLKRFKKAMSRTEMAVLPGQLAFFFVLSIIPLIALLGSIAIGFGIDTNSVINLMESTLPRAAVDLLVPVVTFGKTMNFSVVLFYFSAFVLASNGTHSMIVSSNALYKIPNRDYLFRRIKALIMTIILVSLLTFILVVPAFGDKIVMMLLSLVKSDALSSNLHVLYSLLKYPISIFLIFFNIKLLYVLAPDEAIKSVNTTYGSIFTTFGWIIATEVYSIYVDVFAKYNLFYGSLSNILILLLWFYILAYIFVLGMALNAGFKDEVK